VIFPSGPNLSVQINFKKILYKKIQIRITMFEIAYLKRFLKEEQGRAKYEFLMLSGSVIITAAAIFVLLTGAGSGAGNLGPTIDVGGGFGGGGGGT
jgi:hypothetical protein